METRKVQLSGGTTYTVSLPKRWATEHGVDAGDLLSIQSRDDGSLVVRSIESGNENVGARIDVSGRDAAGARVAVHALYVLGFDRITIGFESDHRECVRAARREADLLIGMEVLERDETTLTLQSVMTAEHVSVRKSVIRLELIVDAMQRDAVTALLDGDADLAADVLDRDDEADKLHALLTRCLRRSLTLFDEVQKLDHDRAGLFEHYHVARQLERIGDHAHKIAGLSADVDPPDDGFESSLAAFDRRAREVRDDATDVLLYDEPVAAAYDAIERCEALAADIEDAQRALYERPDPREAHAYGVALDSVRRTAEYGANVADVAIQRHYRREHWSVESPSPR